MAKAEHVNMATTTHAVALYNNPIAP
jgi:hypothetical protein